MTTQMLDRWAGSLTLVTAGALITAGIAVSALPQTHVLPALCFFIALVLSVPTLIALYAPTARQLGASGMFGFGLAIVGAILYSAPVYILIAGSNGVASWHDLWAFAMGNVLPLGASAFLIGLLVLAARLYRTRATPRWASMLVGVGAVAWLVAFWGLVIAGLPIGSVAIALGFGGIAVERLRQRTRQSLATAGCAV